jgi:hypothetical protein
MHICNIDTPIFSPLSLHHTQQMNINCLFVILSLSAAPRQPLSSCKNMCIYSFLSFHLIYVCFFHPFFQMHAWTLQPSTFSLLFHATMHSHSFSHVRAPNYFGATSSFYLVSCKNTSSTSFILS